MKPVLLLENQLPEKIGYLGTWLEENKIPCVVYNAEIHKEFPSSINDYSALAIMGGAMSANDPLYTSRQAEILILQAMYKDIPVIGHCLGGQLIAKALGARVTESPEPEIGWQEITYLEKPETKQWFGENPTSKVIHWHYDMFEVPTGAKLLATNKSGNNQAFSIGKALAMQFHIEIDEEKIDYWTSDDDVKWAAARETYQFVQGGSEILAGIEPNRSAHQRTAANVYENWLRCLYT